MPSTNPQSLSFFEIRVPKSSETSPEAMAACLKALPKINANFFSTLLCKQQSFVLELVTWNQRIYFMTSVPILYSSYFTSQLVAQYPQSLIDQVSDYVPFLFPKDTNINEKMRTSSFGQLELESPFYLPLKTYKDFTDIDPLSTILGTLAKSHPEDKVVIQYLINNAKKSWQNKGYREANKLIPTSEADKFIANPQKSLIDQKISQSGFNVEIKLLVVSNDKVRSDLTLHNLAGSFSSLTNAEANRLKLTYPLPWRKKCFFQSILDRKKFNLFKKNILTDTELATLYHLPNQNLISIKNIAWGGTLKGEPPEDLPIAASLDEKTKKQTNFFAKTEFKNKETVFGIKKIDRRKHIYIIGKTGVGKSTLIANMAINDMKNGEGVAIIDPHGDLSEIMLDYIPKSRINDVVYLDPNNTERPFRMNPLEVKEPEQAELVASGIVAIFKKLFAYSWGPRLEYILRNTILSLTQVPNTTLLDVPRMLTSHSYRNRVVEQLNDQVLKRFWEKEFNTLDDRARNEAISPILNKVGQFITSPKIRLILERPQSSIDLEDIMNTGKIFILNLSQGKIGEDNAALLGAMFITKIQLAAMNRAYIAEEKRKDFYLYVDEFQNFATSSFIKILSEARKYRLNLAVANQYTAQVEEDVQKAIFGNVGTLMSFLLGAADAKILNEEFGKTYEESDLVSLDNFEIIVKLSIDNRTSTPFPAKTLPLPRSKNSNREKVIKVSTERYGKKQKPKKEVFTPLTKGDASQSEAGGFEDFQSQKEDLEKKSSSNSSRHSEDPSADRDEESDPKEKISTPLTKGDALSNDKAGGFKDSQHKKRDLNKDKNSHSSKPNKNKKRNKKQKTENANQAIEKILNLNSTPLTKGDASQSEAGGFEDSQQTKKSHPKNQNPRPHMVVEIEK